MKVINDDVSVQQKLRDASTNVASDEFSISIEDAYATLEHDRKLKRTCLKMFVAFVQFALVLAMIFSHIPASDTMFVLGNAVSSTLAASGDDTLTSDSRMKFMNIATIGDTFDWLTDTFVPSVFVTEDYNGGVLDKDKWGRVAMFNKVLGGVVFDVVNAKIHPCHAEQYLLDLYPHCYDAAKVTLESKIVSFDTNATEATRFIKHLKARGDWLSFDTQSLTITVVMYNGELQAYAVTTLSLTFHQGGSVEPTSSTTPVLSNPYKSSAPIILDALVGLIALFTFADVCNALYDVHRFTFESTEIFDPALHIIGMLRSVFTMFFICFWVEIAARTSSKKFRDNLAELVVSGKTFDTDSSERSGLIEVTTSLQSIAARTVLQRVLAVAMIVLCGCHVLQRLHLHPHLCLLTRTIVVALTQFRWVFVVFLLLFLTFGTAGTVLFGDRVACFASLGTSLETCVNMLFGNFDYSTIQDVYVPAPMIFYWSYMIVVSLVLLNMMLAIVLDAYADVSATTGKTLRDTSTTRVLRNYAIDVLTMRQRIGYDRLMGASKRRCDRSWTIVRMINILLGRPCSFVYSSEHVFAFIRGCKKELIISHPRVVHEHVLHTLLKALVNEQDDARYIVNYPNKHANNNDTTTNVLPNVVVSEQTLLTWFPKAWITERVIMCTIRRLCEGNDCTQPPPHYVRRSLRERRDETALTRACKTPLPPVRPSEIDVDDALAEPLDIAASDDIDAATAATTKQSEQRAESQANQHESASLTASEQALAAQNARLREQNIALQHKLDCVLRALQRDE